tara:strand:- start:1346 stop:1801 length:456 start_codon:yes stop_codon:yes gene_type:complete
MDPLSRLVKTINSMDLNLPKNREHHLSFPEDLSLVHMDELGRHLSYWASVCSYVIFQISLIEGQLVIKKQSLEEETDLRLYAKLKRGDMTATMAKSAVGSSKTVLELRREIAQMEADLKVLKAVSLGYDLKNSAVSREISRRQQERNLRDD